MAGANIRLSTADDHSARINRRQRPAPCRGKRCAGASFNRCHTGTIQLLQPVQSVYGHIRILVCLCAARRLDLRQSGAAKYQTLAADRAGRILCRHAALHWLWCDPLFIQRHTLSLRDIRLRFNLRLRRNRRLIDPCAGLSRRRMVWEADFADWTKHDEHLSAASNRELFDLETPLRNLAYFPL